MPEPICVGGSYTFRFNDYDLMMAAQGSASGKDAWRKPWHLLVATCKSLRADGIDYETALISAKGGNSQVEPVWHVRLNLFGPYQPLRKRKTRAKRPKVGPPAPLTVRRCGKELSTALQNVDCRRCAMLGRFKDYSLYPRHRYNYERDSSRAAREQRRDYDLGRWLAKWLAMGLECLSRQDYADLDAITGSPVRRIGSLRAHEIRGIRYASQGQEHVKAYVSILLAKRAWRTQFKPVAMKPFDIDGYHEACDNVTHWREMLRLVNDTAELKLKG